MKLNDSFWKHFELDLQEIKPAYLNWAIGYTRRPKPKYRHLFLWRVSEINRSTWGDVDFQDQSITLYTRKKKGGYVTPRRIPMTQKLYEILVRRHVNRDPDKPWIFWHRYWSRKHGRFVEGPYGDRKKLMKRLCKKAGVRYFRFHPIRHSGASMMDGNNVPLSAIQRILGYENRRTTGIYRHSIGDLEKQAIIVKFRQMMSNSAKLL